MSADIGSSSGFCREVGRVRPRCRRLRKNFPLGRPAGLAAAPSEQ